jgi:hypothetical protein
MFKRLFSLVLAVLFLANSVLPSYAQGVLLGKGMAVLPEPGVMVGLSKPVNPPVLCGIKVSTKDPLKFEFILDPGDKQRQARIRGQVDGAMQAELKDESQRLVNYFLTTLTIPDEDIWVNLSPYEKDRITTEKFGQTQMGRDLLAQDYLLKQITASLLYPEGDAGKKFWARVYAMAEQKFGTTEIPVDTFNKVWIMPEKAEIYENVDQSSGQASAFVVSSSLKVMLESDYLAQTKEHGTDATSQTADGQEFAKAVAREVIIPLLQKEVNEGENFSALRQVYGSIILALWYKEKLQGSILASVYVDRNKIAGVDVQDKEVTRKIWAQYVEAFKKGAVDLIKEEKDPLSGEVIPRKYFAGGFGIKGRDFSEKISRRSFLGWMAKGAGALALGGGLIKVLTSCEKVNDYVAPVIDLSPEELTALDQDLQLYAQATNDLERRLYDWSKELDKIKSAVPQYYPGEILAQQWRALDFFVKRMKALGVDYSNDKLKPEGIHSYNKDGYYGSQRTVAIFFEGQEYPFDIVNPIKDGQRFYFLIPRDGFKAHAYYEEYNGTAFSDVSLSWILTAMPQYWNTGRGLHQANVHAGLDLLRRLFPDKIRGVKDLLNLDTQETPIPVFGLDQEKIGPDGRRFVPVSYYSIDWGEDTGLQDQKKAPSLLARIRNSFPTGKVLILSALLMISASWYGCEKYEPKMPSYYSVTLTSISDEDQKALDENMKDYVNATNEVEKKLYDLALSFDQQIKDNGGSLKEPLAQLYFWRWNGMSAFVKKLKQIGIDYTDWKISKDGVNLYGGLLVGAGTRTVRIETIWEQGQLPHVFEVVNVTGAGPVVIPQDYNLTAAFFPEYASIPGWTPEELFWNLTSRFSSDPYSPIVFRPADILAGLAILGKEPKDLQGEKLPVPFWPSEGPSEIKYRGVTITAIDGANWAEDMSVVKNRSIVPDASEELREGGIDFKKSSMPLEMRGRDGSVLFSIDPASLQSLDLAPGLKGVIIQMDPLQSLPVFLGMSQDEIKQIVS